MQTTLRIQDDVYRRAKGKAGELGVSLTRFFEEAVERRLEELERQPARPVRLPVSSVAGPPLEPEELRRRLAAADLAADRERVP